MPQLQKFLLMQIKFIGNSLELIQNILKLKPSSSKGTYVKSISMSSTMSPGINIDTNI